MTNQNTKTPKLTFNCTCSGCRGYSTKPAQIWHESQLKSVTNGYFFSRDTMKFFSSRVANFKPLTNLSGDDGLAVIVSNKFEPTDPRHYEIITICQYGEINRFKSDEPSDWAFRKYTNLRAAKRALDLIIYPMACDCHGCQLDRAGVSIKDRRGF